MAETGCAAIIEHFSQLPDPRILMKTRHHLVDIVAMALCVVIPGAGRMGIAHSDTRTGRDPGLRAEWWRTRANLQSAFVTGTSNRKGSGVILPSAGSNR